VSSTAVHLDRLTRHFGALTALNELDLDVNAGEMLALLGPSGCGKTTALRLLGGFDYPDGGRVMVGGKDVTKLPPSKRDMGMVFQAYSLFPNMNARRNVEFGLRMRRMAAASRRAQADKMLELVGLSEHGDRYPHQLSGGQQQRVALARALAIEPSVLLLDEPLSALDARVRNQLRVEIRRVQQELGTTTLFVTHDQAEALSIADRVGVMSSGRLEQLDTPEEIYNRPATPFVAEFVGTMNRVAGRVLPDGRLEVLGSSLNSLGGADGHGAGSVVEVLVRPEALEVSASPTGHAVVDERTFLGSLTRLRVTLDDGAALLVDAASRQDLPGPGTRVSLRVIGEDALVGGDPGQLAPIDELDPEPTHRQADGPASDRLRDGLI
jgi:putative spermidine/putrescine transport system ATP-binding protein